MILRLGMCGWRHSHTNLKRIGRATGEKAVLGFIISYPDKNYAQSFDITYICMYIRLSMNPSHKATYVLFCSVIRKAV